LLSGVFGWVVRGVDAVGGAWHVLGQPAGGVGAVFGVAYGAGLAGWSSMAPPGLVMERRER
jgi:hypothetical protein